MQEVLVKGKRVLCFVVADGEHNKIVIPQHYLKGVDYHRLLEIEKKGGNMLKHMRDTKLDNGVTALETYYRLFVTVPKPPKPKKETEEKTNSGDSVEEPQKTPRRRRRGRPPTKQSESDE